MAGDMSIETLNPLYDALLAITNNFPPEFTKGVYHSSELNDEQFGDLQEWAANHGRFHWFTGIGIIDAADTLVMSSVENGNIPAKSVDDDPVKEASEDFQPLQGTGLEDFSGLINNTFGDEFECNWWQQTYTVLLDYFCRDQRIGDDYEAASKQLKRLSKNIGEDLDLRTSHAAFLVGAYVMHEVIRLDSDNDLPRPAAAPRVKEVRVVEKPASKPSLDSYVYPCGLRVGDIVIGLHETGKAEGAVWVPPPGHSPFRVCVANTLQVWGSGGVTAAYLDPKNIVKASRDNVELVRQTLNNGSVRFVLPEDVDSEEPVAEPLAEPSAEAEPPVPADTLRPLLFHYPCGLEVGDQVVLKPFAMPVEVLPSIGGKRLRYLDVDGYENQAEIWPIVEAYRNGVRLDRTDDVDGYSPVYSMPKAVN